MMSGKILIIKTGNTLPSLLDENEDFEDWFIRGTGLEANRFVCCAVDKGESLPAIDDVVAAIVTGSPAYVTDLAPWNEIAAGLFMTPSPAAKTYLGRLLWASITGVGLWRCSRFSSRRQRDRNHRR